MKFIKNWISSRSVFTVLLCNTVFSTIILASVLIIALQQIADEHPRRQLAKTLFRELVSDKSKEQLQKTEVNGYSLIVVSDDDRQSALYKENQKLIETAREDADGVAVIHNGKHYRASILRQSHHDIVILPMFGSSLSTTAWFLIGLIVLTTITVLLFNFWSIRRLTLPFSELTRGAHLVESGQLNYRIPIEKTYGEYKELAINFNNMVQTMEHIHEARRHMLLAIPHEVRAPLTRLKVRKDLIVDQKLRENILKDINDIENIISAILCAEKASLQHSELGKQVDLVHIISTILPDFQNENQIIHFNRSASGLLYSINPDLFEILIRNLVSNAVFYGKNQPINITIKKEHKNITISIKDQGIGIEQQHIPFLTEPFWRIDPSRQRQSGGYGLGLYICKMIVSGLGGTLNIESEVGSYTCVTIEL